MLENFFACEKEIWSDISALKFSIISVFILLTRIKKNKKKIKSSPLKIDKRRENVERTQRIRKSIGKVKEKET